jgi:hypothetical protein
MHGIRPTSYNCGCNYAESGLASEVADIEIESEMSSEYGMGYNGNNMGYNDNMGYNNNMGERRRNHRRNRRERNYWD